MDNETMKLRNAINFYMLANNLKYITNDGYQSVADQIYESMILATAINSEYNKVENLGTTLRMILLGAISEYYNEELRDILKKMNDGDLYALDTCEYYKSEDFHNKNGRFAWDCTIAEHKMEYFFEKFIVEEKIQTENVEELYVIAKNHGLTDNLGNDEKKNFEIFRFYYLNRVLKKKIRCGWDSNHWNVSSDRVERISEHVVGTIALATAFASEFDFHIDLDKVNSVLCIHEVGEINIGDITPFDGITPEQKQEIEHKAIIEVIGNLSKQNDMVNSIFEFDMQETNEAKFAHYCDKLEADIQAKVYQDMGCQHSLSEQQNNVVFKSSKIQKMIQDGATTAFDIWYEWDKSIYIDEPIFSKTLKYIKDTKLK